MSRPYMMETNRLGFSEWREDDLELAMGLWGDPLVSRLISANGRFSEQAIRERLQTEIQNNLKFQVQYWPVFELSSGSMIGCCGLRPYHNEAHIFELGFHFKPEHWGKGYAHEAASAVLEHARSHLKAEFVVAGHHPDNMASAKLLSKLGFEYTHHEYYEATGLEHPTYQFKYELF
ncbi:GNAT family N-acetyltransferase [Paenibacillus sp. Y412MC10]|uniref:GNAT family N-acetyltransferase n=1 Tax=Geobacillus sp. (strain Y412MC10) TaxID=481743 RepID=UPI0011AA26E2|nr:GNAT family N-acetyltransferase [Paenibacillus sp. Y412MC10]